MEEHELRDVSLDRRERRRLKKRRSRQRAFVLAFIVLLLLAAAVFFAAKWDDLSPKGISEQARFADSKKDEAFADITGSSVLENNISLLDTGLIYISDTSIVQLNHDCERVFSEKHSFSNPFIRTSGQYSIAFGEGSGEYRLIYDKHKIFEGVQGTAITDCAVNSSGTYGVLSDKTGYLSALSVYDKNNKFIYSYSFSDYYAVTVAISRDGQKVVVGGINSSDGRLVSKVYLLDVTKSEPIQVFTYQDQLLYKVEFISDDHFSVVTDMLTSVIKSDGSREVPYSYDSQVLTAFTSCYGEKIVLSLSNSDDGRSCSIVTLNAEGNEEGRFQTDLRVTALSATADRTAVLSYSMLGIYDKNGISFGEWTIGSDAKSVLMPQNKIAYVLGVSGISKYSLK